MVAPTPLLVIVEALPPPPLVVDTEPPAPPTPPLVVDTAPPAPAAALVDPLAPAVAALVPPAPLLVAPGGAGLVHTPVGPQGEPPPTHEPLRQPALTLHGEPSGCGVRAQPFAAQVPAS